MDSPKRRYVLVGIAAALLVIALVLPIVPYTLRASPPGFPYDDQGYRACEAQFIKNNVINFSDPGFQRCIAAYLLAPLNVTGHGSLSYRLLGVGLPPFPERLLVGETGFHAYLYTDGASITAAQEVNGNQVVYDPAGISISGSSLTEGFLGYSNLTVTVTNESDQTLADPVVLASAPGNSGNYTDKNGITWIFSLDSPSGTLLLGPCLTNGSVGNLTSGGTCSVTLHPIISTPFGSSFRYTVEVEGTLGLATSITKQTISYSISAQAADSLWVDGLIKLVNSARPGSPLVESSSLDAFAEQRFNTAVTQPDISDYGFVTDASKFFGENATRPAVTEDLLFPTLATQDPYTYVNSLQGAAPGHWASLTDKNYTHFGFYVGTGPYEVVRQPCPISEVLGAGVNITQYFESAGCSVSVQQSTWLVIVLGS